MFRPNYLILLPVLLLGTTASMADNLTPDEALDKALGFLRQPVRARGEMSAPMLSLAHTSASGDETYYYAFNVAAGGYVIVAGNDVAYDVLGYGERGRFDYAQLPPAMKWWLGQYEAQIHHAIALGSAPAQHNAARRAAENLPAIEPLLGGIEWDQDLPYNAFLFGNDQEENSYLRYLTGCTATATAQVMRYWKYPERGRFSHACHVSSDREVNFANSEYRWDLMCEKYAFTEQGGTYSGTPEEDAVALLMHDVGHALNTEYGCPFNGGSISYSECVAYALYTYFGYSTKATFLARKNVNDDEVWENLIYQELAAGRPVVYGGMDPDGGGGHSFVCDGYKDGRYHINWGWNGESNDYFLLTATDTELALRPNDSGIGGNNASNYGFGQDAVIGIEPDPESEGFLYLTELIDVPVETPKQDFTIKLKIYNPTSQDIKRDIYVFMRDELANSYIERDLKELLNFPAKQETTVTFDIPGEELLAGAYYDLYFFFIDEDNHNVCFSKSSMHVEGPLRIPVSVPKSGYTTLCVPFDCDVPSGFEAYTIEGISADNKVMLKQAESIEAGVCYVVSGTKPYYEIEGEVKTDQMYADGPLAIGLMSREAQYGTEPMFGFTYLNGIWGFFRIKGAYPWYPYSVMIHADAIDDNVNVLGFEFVEDQPTGIQQIGQTVQSQRLNLMGQPLREAGGLMIRDGRVTFRR